MNQPIDTMAASIENCMAAWAVYGDKVRGKPITDLKTFIAGYVSGLHANLVLSEKSPPTSVELPPNDPSAVLRLSEAVVVEPMPPFKRSLHGGYPDTSPVEAED